VLLHGIGNCLPHHKPISSDSLLIRFGSGLADVVIVHHAPEIKNPRCTGSEGGLCKEKICFYFLFRGFLSLSADSTHSLDGVWRKKFPTQAGGLWNPMIPKFI
jgi:hypothetical protein